jgi:tRNA(Ile)-lysidine synthase TilS/MesJ
LLFLLNQYLTGHNPKPEDTFEALHSLTVDHDIQESSEEMAQCAEANAHSMGVPHVTRKIPWSDEGPFKRPEPGQPFESEARTARYAVTFRLMTEVKSSTIAFAHHADDQLETALIRISRGSTEYGAAGMRPVRRWGMGTAQAPFNYAGLHRWIVRPLLDFSKACVHLYSLVHRNERYSGQDSCYLR